MCWIAVNKSDLDRLIAKDNIPVTKIVSIFGKDNVFGYFYNDFNYKIGEVYNTSLDEPYLSFNGREVEYILYCGFHSYSTKLKIIKRDSQLIDVKINHKFMNSFVKTFKHPNRGVGNIAIADCIIPKGCAYYLNSYGEYVSNSIKIINVYKIK